MATIIAQQNCSLSLSKFDVLPTSQKHGIALNQHGGNVYCFFWVEEKRTESIDLENSTCDLRLYPHCYPTRRARDLENMTHANGVYYEEI